MKKTLNTLLIILLVNLSYSQTKSDNLKFDTKFYNAIDKYAAFPNKEKDSTYMYGFIYIDQMAGITLRLYGTFKNDDGVFISSEKKLENGMMIYRLNRQTSDVHVLNESQMNNLELDKNPEWLKVYKANENSAEYMKDIGYHLNAVGGSQTALSYLEKAYKLEPHLEGLEFELGFAYNALQNFDKAIPVLEAAIKNDSDNFLFYKELGFAYKFSGPVEKTEETYKKGIEISNSEQMKAEMALNMTHTYFELRNREKFDEWAKLTRKFSKPDSPFQNYIAMFEKDWEKK